MDDPQQILSRAPPWAGPSAWTVFTGKRGAVHRLLHEDVGRPDPLVVVTPDGSRGVPWRAEADRRHRLRPSSGHRAAGACQHDVRQHARHAQRLAGPPLPGRPDREVAGAVRRRRAASSRASSRPTVPTGARPQGDNVSERDQQKKSRAPRHGRAAVAPSTDSSSSAHWSGSGSRLTGSASISSGCSGDRVAGVPRLRRLQGAVQLTPSGAGRRRCGGRCLHSGLPAGARAVPAAVPRPGVNAGSRSSAVRTFRFPDEAELAIMSMDRSWSGVLRLENEAPELRPWFVRTSSGRPRRHRVVLALLRRACHLVASRGFIPGQRIAAQPGSDVPSARAGAPTGDQSRHVGRRRVTVFGPPRNSSLCCSSHTRSALPSGDRLAGWTVIHTGPIQKDGKSKVKGT